MFKLGRGGAGAGGSGRGSGGKRALPPPPPPRPGARPPAARGAGRGGRQGPGGGGGEPPSREETFSLVPGPSLNFAAIIRLTPDIVNEIRRAEAQGGAARIKFDSNPNNHSGNVIDIGGKEFRFTWSRELGDLCDIYEERQSGEDGHGLLVERGAAWRKLNVQRILDESTKNHVKMLSEEAERLSKARKSIVLDPANPSVKNQAKTIAAAAVEGSMRRMSWKHKKDTFFKKHKGEQNPGPSVVSSKPFPKGGISSNNMTRAMPAVVSPQLSPPEQPGPGTSSSPIGAANYTKEDLNIEEIFGSSTGGKEDTSSFGKEMSCNVNDRDIAGQHRDLRSLLISRLSENPKGMNLKSLEKAVGGMIPNAEKKIESILKNIAIFQAPGRYILKPGVEVENHRKRGSESGSSPESAHDHTGAAESFFPEKGSQENIEQETKLNSKLEEEADPFTVIDMNPSGPDHFSGKEKVGNEIEARANSSSESGSDSESDSDSSDSESDSGSQSHSPAGSASASSSNSESDNSSSSKEGSDVDVDIMTSDDEKEEAEHKAEAANAKLSSSPGEWQQNDGVPVQNGNVEGHQDEHFTSSPVDMNDFDVGDERDVDIIDSPVNYGPKASEIFGMEISKSAADLETDPMNSKYSTEVLAFSPDKHKKTNRPQAYTRNSTDDPNQQTFDRSATGTQTIFSEKSGPDKMGVKGKNSKAKSRKASDREEFQEKSETCKRSKSTSSAKTLYSGKSKDSTNSENLQNITPEKSRPGQYKDHILQADNNMKLNANSEASMQDYSLSVPGKFKTSGNFGGKQPGPDFQNTPSYEGDQPGQRIGNFSGKRKALNNVDKSTRYVENSGRGNKLAETLSVHPDESDATIMKSMSLHENVPMGKNKLHKDLRDENGDSSERYLTKNMRESIAGDKLSSTPDSYSRKSGELKDSGQVPQFRRSDTVNPAVVDRKGIALRRELSDLELGEFREPLVTEENVGVKRLFERKDSFKSSDNKVATSINLEQDMNKGRTVTNSTIDSKRQSPFIIGGGSNGKQDGFDRRIEDNLVTSSRPQQRVMASQGQPFLKDQVDSEAVSHLDKSTEIVGRTEKKTNEGIGLESHAPRNDHIRGGPTGSKTIKESKSQKRDSLRDSADQGNNTAWVESNANDRGRRESSSDEDSFFYTKYDKDEPELKPPIKDYLQYKEYVQEYREKYGHYCSLNKNLENLRNDFLGLGQELERAGGRDSEEYYAILEQLKQMYRQHGEKHKQMKKVFILLHEELKHIKQRIKDFAETYYQE